MKWLIAKHITYDEALAKDVYRRLSSHLPLLQTLDEHLRNARA